MSNAPAQLDPKAFTLSTAALVTSHSIRPMTTAAADKLAELREAIPVSRGSLKPLMVSGALVVEPGDLAFAVEFLGAVRS